MIQSCHLRYCFYTEVFFKIGAEDYGFCGGELEDCVLIYVVGGDKISICFLSR